MVKPGRFALHPLAEYRYAAAQGSIYGAVPKHSIGTAPNILERRRLGDCATTV